MCTRADVFAQHKAIFEAISRRDAPAAEAAMESHLETVARHYWRAMGAGHPDPA